MIELTYQGWFQCRLANDPDPTDEPRGVSGCSFATVGEPDLDRIIRLQEPVVHRSHMPSVGVTVQSAVIDGSPVAGHPLEGAEVAWLDGAMFEEQNGVAVEVNHAVIEPFHLRIEGGGVTLQRRAVWDPADPAKDLYDLPVDDPAVIARQPHKLDLGDPTFLNAAGIGDPDQYLAARKLQVQRELELEGDELARAALQQRLDAFNRTDFCAMRRTRLLGARILYSFELNGSETRVEGNGGLPSIDRQRPWPVEFWLGAWDNDVLCGFIMGTVTIPTAE